MFQELQRIQSIMGANFLGPQEAVQYLGINPTSKQLNALEAIPDEKTIVKAGNNRVLVADFGLSVEEIQRAVPDLLRKPDNDWIKKQRFFQERGEIGWRLVYKYPAPNSISLSWNDQLLCLGQDNQVPSGRLIIYTMVGYFLATGERLFEHITVRTSTITEEGFRVGLRFDEKEGIIICGYRDNFRGNNFTPIGLASERTITLTSLTT